MRAIMPGNRETKTLTDVLISQAEMKGQLTQISINLGERVKQHDVDIDSLFSKFNNVDRRLSVTENKQLDISQRLTSSFTRNIAIITTVIGGIGIIITLVNLARSV